MIRLVLFCCLLTPALSIAQIKNLSFDEDISQYNSDGWVFPIMQSEGFIVDLDSSAHKDGNRSMSITSNRDGQTFGGFMQTLDNLYSGDSITLAGYIKTDHVWIGAYAGLLLIVKDASGNNISFNDMSTVQLSGTNDWSFFKISVPLTGEAKKIQFGGILFGKGRAWFDQIQLYIDGQNIASLAPPRLPNASSDTSFSIASNLKFPRIDKHLQKKLAKLGHIWAFLKYYHPAVIEGTLNWDAELFRFLPEYIKAKSEQQETTLLIALVQKLNALSPIKPAETSDRGARKFDVTREFDPNSEPLKHLLANIQDSIAKKHENQYYVEAGASKNATFSHERAYETVLYPDAGLRLLCLYRYWGMINYFYPYKYLGDNWNKVLEDFVPKFINAKNEEEYHLTISELVAKIHDSHATVNTRSINAMQGAYTLPLKLSAIERKFVVTQTFADCNLKLGTVVLKINGQPIKSLIQKYKKYVSASNEATLIRDLTAPYGWVTRSNTQSAQLDISEDGKMKVVFVHTIKVDSLYRNFAVNFGILPPPPTSFHILNGSIGYIYPGLLKESQIDSIKQAFAAVKGIIIDLRCYPSYFMPYSFGEWLKDALTPFAAISRPDFIAPGNFTERTLDSNGPLTNEKSASKRVVMLVNEYTQSAAEFTVMSLSTISNAKVFGSQTAGADGNYSAIVLPGGVKTGISGLGIYYPDGGETQGVGIRIDKKVNPTLAGVQAGYDELLSAAVEYLMQ